jgi:sugar phosphate isomerase/epimerase
MNLPIAIQLFSIKNTVPNDVEGTFLALKEMGYDGVEFAGLYGKSAQEIRDICDRVGIIPISAHISFPAIRDELDKHVEDCVTLGVKYVAIATMHREYHIGGEKNEGVYESLKEISARFREKGIKLLYHNHSYEMCEFEGKRLHEWLFDIMTPDELQPELDTGWIELEVGEAVDYVRKFKDRCDLVHVKSYYAKDGFDELVHSPDNFKPRDTFDFCNYENGRLDVPAVARAAVESGAKWLVVEQDRPDEGLTELGAAKVNLDFLKSL